VLDDVARRVARGQSEIVLTGVNIGLYRCSDSRASLWSLLPQIADVAGVTRVRISSIEVNHVSRRLVDAIAAHDKVCPHLHVPLQSGSDAVLASMHRHYDSARYRKAIAYAREQISGLNLTTDIIVGYPAETDDAFAETLAFADEMQFTKIHAFPFSPRPGTEADAAADPIEKSTKKVRSLALREQADLHARTHWQSRVGTYDEVIVERSGSRSGMSLTDAHVAAGASGVSDDSEVGTSIGGYTRDYCPVRIEGDAPDGSLVDVEITGFDARGLIARMR
jgi:threonylcarbamoyladenosine tRNA methylthiotransferase MtaB